MQKIKPKIEIKLGVLIDTDQWKSIPTGVAVVYKLIFATGKYYVGSSSDLRKRAQVFHFNFISKRYTIKNLSVESKISESCFMEVLEIVNDRSMLLEREDVFIKQLYGENILNRSKNSCSNKGIKWTDEEKKGY